MLTLEKGHCTDILHRGGTGEQGGCWIRLIRPSMVSKRVSNEIFSIVSKETYYSVKRDVLYL
jgi:hypothetical protein